MLAANLAIQRLLLSLVIVRNAVVCLESSDIPVKIPEVVKVPLASESSEVTSVSSIEPRILKRISALKRENHRNPMNTTLLKKITEEIDEVDTTTTTHSPGPVSMESTSMKTMEFKPSVHIGEIHDYEHRKSTTSPFNNLQHVKFENSVSIDDRHTGRVRAPLSFSSLSFHSGERANPVVRRKKNRLKFFETDSRYGVAVPAEYYIPQQIQQETEEVVGNEDDINNNDDNDNHNHLMPMKMGHEGVVTFEYPTSHYAEVTARPMTLERPVYTAMMKDQQMHLQHYEPGINYVPTFYAKPSKLHGEVEVLTPMPPVRIQHYEYVAPVSSEAIEKPEVLEHHRESYRVVPQLTDTAVGTADPETVLYLTSHRETAITRTRKFPYKFYHPEAGNQDNEYYYASEGQHTQLPKQSKISPWKKIIHLIGAFIPLGLLLATLKPNVVRLDTQNATQPNFIFSKLRDLPAEHKRGRLEHDTCEDKSICELIVSGSEQPHASLLQNILWNLTNNSTDETAKKHGLHEIFAAVKQKDCSSIDC